MLARCMLQKTLALCHSNTQVCVLMGIGAALGQVHVLDLARCYMDGRPRTRQSAAETLRRHSRRPSYVDSCATESVPASADLT